MTVTQEKYIPSLEEQVEELCKTDSFPCCKVCQCDDTKKMWSYGKKMWCACHREQLKQALLTAEKREEERWMYQPANDHDNKIRKAERKRCVEIIKSEKVLEVISPGSTQLKLSFKKWLNRRLSQAITNINKDDTIKES